MPLDQSVASNTQPLAPAARRRRHRDEMTAAILEAARAIMRAQGTAALNLNEVARRLGVKTPSLYEYFPGGKMQVYDALFRQGMALFAERQAPLHREPAWGRYLRASIEAYLQFALDYPELYQICFERPVPGFEPSPESLAVSLAAYQAVVAEITRRLAEGQLTPPPGLTPQQVVDLGIAMLHGLTAQHLANEPHLPVGEGRFGGLIPAAVALFENAWSPTPPSEEPSP
jgi:AcrR family transcriptional regulator